MEENREKIGAINGLIFLIGMLLVLSLMTGLFYLASNPSDNLKIQTEFYEKNMEKVKKNYNIGETIICLNYNFYVGRHSYTEITFSQIFNNKGEFKYIEKDPYLLEKNFFENKNNIYPIYNCFPYNEYKKFRTIYATWLFRKDLDKMILIPINFEDFLKKI